MWLMRPQMSHGRWPSARLHLFGAAPIQGHDEQVALTSTCPLCKQESEMGTVHYLGLGEGTCELGRNKREIIWARAKKEMSGVLRKQGLDGQRMQWPEWEDIVAFEVAGWFLGGWLIRSDIPVSDMRPGRRVMEEVDKYCRQLHEWVARARADMEMAPLHSAVRQRGGSMGGER